MKIVLVTWTLLLFGASLSSGHYIHQSEDNSVYSVKDGASDITFVNPKPKGPTLREILYYHVIEREPGESPEHSITERSFTNSHGYQFLEHQSSDEQEEYDGEEHDESLHEHEHENENEEHEGDGNEHEETDEFHDEEETEKQDEEDPESSTTLKPLTDADVKNAYKARSYLFDQMRQRYAVKRMADSLHRKKRQAETEELKPLPEAPQLSDIAGPNTYGMNINPQGGYVWNNLNKPSYYELGASNGNPSEGQDASQGQENIPTGDNANAEQPNTDNTETINENHESNEDDLSDICVDMNKPCALRLQRSQEPNAENSEENYENSDVNNSGANSDESTDDTESDDSESNDGIPNYPKGYVAFKNPELSSDEPNTNSGEESNKPDEPKTYGMSLTSGGGRVWNDLVNPPVSYEVGSSNENPEPINEANYPVEPIIAGDEPNNDSGSDDGASALIELGVSENPESGYPADAVAENSEGMEGVLATMPPPEDIPKTYGMNLTSDGGHVWNTLVNPPVSYDIGSSNENPEPVHPNPESNTSDENHSAEPIASGEAASNSESNEEVDSQTPEISEIPEPSYNDAAENGPILNANGQPGEASDDNSESNEGAYPKEPEVYENPTIYNPPVSDSGSSNEHSASNEHASSIENSEQNESEQENESYGESQSEEKPASPEESSELDKPKEPLWNIPEAPTLPPLNYDNLPDYIRDVISSTEKSEYYQPTDSPNPAYSYPQTSPEDQTMEDKIDVPNTYGMSLNGDGGHVWNYMVNPPVSYDVGSPSKSEEEHEEEPTQESNEQPESHESVEVIEEQPAYPSEPETQEESKEPDNYEPEPEIPETEPIEEPTEPVVPETEPIEEPTEPVVPETEPNEEPAEPVPVPETEPIKEPAEPVVPETEPIEEPAEPVVPETEPIEEPAEPVILETEPIEEPAEPVVLETEPIEEPAEPVLPENEPIEEPAEPEPVPVPETEPIEEEPAEPVVPETTDELENPELNLEPEGEEIHEEKQPEDIEEPSEENHDNLGEQEKEPAEVKPDENAKPDIMNDLLKSDQFWRWLGVWTATYMELLEKHIRKIALEEICNHQRIGDQMCPLNDYSEDAEFKRKDEKIVVDGIEMDLTHRDNLDTELKRGHHNQNNHNKGDGTKIEASTIYGNSVGNEKVTNVFIFTADKADEVIDKLKPANDSDIDFIIDERIKEEQNKDKNEAPGDLAHKDDSDVDVVSEEGSNEAEANNSDFDKGEADKEESIESEANNESKEETNKDEEESNKEEDSKQESNENKPNKEEFEIVKNSKEESNEGEALEEDKSQDSKPIEEELIKEGSKEGEDEEDDLNKEEDNKEALSEVDASEELTEEDHKEESTEEQLNNEEENKEGSTDTEVSEEDLNKKETLSEGEANEEEEKKDEASEGSNESTEMLDDELNKDSEIEEQK